MEKFFDSEEQAVEIITTLTRKAKRHAIRGKGHNTAQDILLYNVDQCRKQFGSKKGNALIVEANEKSRKKRKAK